MSKKTHIAIALDSSGSMNDHGKREAALAAFNQQVDVIQEEAEKGGETFVTLVLFGHHMNAVEVKKDKVPAADLQKMKLEEYVPTANTPFRDAVGLSISTLEAEDEDGADVSFMVVVISDGLENASREWSPSALAGRVRELQETDRWNFATFVAEGLDMSEIDNLGIPAGNVGTFDNTGQGVRQTSAAMAAGTRSYMSARHSGDTSFTSYAESEDEDD